MLSWLLDRPRRARRLYRNYSVFHLEHLRRQVPAWRPWCFSWLLDRPRRAATTLRGLAGPGDGLNPAPVLIMRSFGPTTRYESGTPGPYAFLHPEVTSDAR